MQETERDERLQTRHAEREEIPLTKKEAEERPTAMQAKERHEIQPTQEREPEDIMREASPSMHEIEREDRLLTRDRVMEASLSMDVTTREESPLTRSREGEEEQKRRARKRKCNKKKSNLLNDVGSGIPLVHDKALTGCLPMGCHGCENNGGLPCGDKDDDTGNAQLCLSFCNDGRH